VAGELALSLFELNLERARVNFGKQVALVDELSFLEGDIDELPIDAAVNGHSVESGDCAEAVEVDGKIAFLCGGDNYGDHKVGGIGSPAAATSTGFGRRISGL